MLLSDARSLAAPALDGAVEPPRAAPPPAPAPSYALPPAQARYSVPQGTHVALQRLPPVILGSLTPFQIDAISRSLEQGRSRHMIDYRASVPLVGGRYYVTLLIGRERRSRERIISESQVGLGKISMAYLFGLYVIAGLGAIWVLLVLYFLKSLLGIDLFEGHSVVHKILG